MGMVKCLANQGHSDGQADRSNDGRIRLLAGRCDMDT